MPAADRTDGKAAAPSAGELHAGEPRDIPLHCIDPNPSQPRQRFEAAHDEELAASIRRHGLLQPVLVTPAPDDPTRFLLVAGERRWRAARAAGAAHVPARVISADARKRLEVSLVENVQRRGLSAVERARAYAALIHEFGLTQAQVARAVSLSRSAVANTLRLLELADDVREALDAGRISEGHGRALLAVRDPWARRELFQRILRQGLSVREAERAARQPPAARPAPRGDAELSSLQERLQRRLAARVRIVGTRRRGHIRIDYAAPEDLDTLLDDLLGGGGS